MGKRFLLIGIGGMGMAPLALYLRQQNHDVYGYDDALPTFLEHFLEQQKIIICKVFPENIDYVVYSSAISSGHPWLIEAKKHGIETCLRGKFLAKSCNGKKMIAITGSHGKTTVTGMLIDCLHNCDYILGGFFRDEKKLPAKYASKTDFFICEVDESDHTIEHFSPHVAVALNLEDDHLAQYGSSENLDLAFEKFFKNTQRLIVLPDGDMRLENIIKNANVTAGIIKVKIANNLHGFDENLLMLQGILGALLGALKADGLKMDALTKFSPLFRRNQFLGRLDWGEGIEIWADYAHHPTEITQCIARFNEEGKRIDFVFQPHRYTRTQQYAQAFAKAFADKNCTFLPVYSAGEKFLADGTTETILKHSPKDNKFNFITSLNDFFIKNNGNKLQNLNKNIFPDKIIFTGAGDIFRQAQAWFFKQQIQLLKIFFTKQGIPFSENISAKKYNTLRIGGIIALMVEAENIEMLAVVLQELTRIKIPFLVVGYGSNLLIDDLCGVWISLQKMPSVFTFKGNLIEVSAGFPLPIFCKQIAKLGLQGSEELAGIPGTIGGALYMNAGTSRQTISDKLVSIDVINSSGDRQTISKSQINFTYRKGFRGGIILRAKFQFIDRQAPEILLEKIHKKMLWRREFQPQQPNVGSIFKNPQNSPAGILIDQANLKGTQIGGAKISEKHANFIINADGQATANDVKQLINLVRQKVFEQHGIFLEREILFASEIFKTYF
ncbi:MAG: UDP-N-acetylmuramate dehydrogenase [Puniceicoccales bacterium]|jgi:UDP-N-acetylenolpyruvoylglucosamine reductase|nr:UDP-N-acetylmuramate dehydrogenase [Puniceicoccales bacterium]